MSESSSRRSGSNRSRGRRRSAPPKLTGWQKFLKAITFGAVDPAKSKRGKKSGSSSRRRSSGPVAAPTTSRLYVGNLNYEVTDEDLNELFSAFGGVKETFVVRHGGSGRSKGFGFVEMDSVELAKAAAAKLHDSEYKGRKMLVTGAKGEKNSADRGSKRDERQPRSRNGERSERREPSSRDGCSRQSGNRSGGGKSRGREARPERENRQVKVVEVEQVTSNKLLMKGVNVDATDMDFSDLFSQVADFTEVDAMEAADGKLTKECHVSFAEVEHAQRAVELLNGKTFMGHRLTLTGA